MSEVTRHPAAAAAAPKGWSLRRSLLAILLTLTISVWGVSAYIVYLDADQESHELFDQSLAETAHLLLALAGHEVEEMMAMDAPSLVETNHEAHSQYVVPDLGHRKALAL